MEFMGSVSMEFDKVIWEAACGLAKGKKSRWAGGAGFGVGGGIEGSRIWTKAR